MRAANPIHALRTLIAALGKQPGRHRRPAATPLPDKLFAFLEAL